MKYLFAVSAAVIAVMTGWRKAARLTYQSKLISDIVLFLNDLKSRISYLREPLPKIISEYAENENITFIKSCSSYLEKYEFPDAWKKSVEEENLLSSAEKNLMIELGKKIGRADSEAEICFIEYIISRFKIILSEKQDKEKKDKRLFRFIGVSAGILCFLIIV